MKKLAFLFITIFLISCGNKSSKEFASLDEETLSQKITELQNSDQTEKFIDALNFFVDKYPQNEKTPDYLKALASIHANYRKNINQAITLYKKIINKYPESNAAPDAYFTLGFIYSNELKDYNSAKSYYNEFINKFPEHEAVESAKFEVQHMGKSEEEILKSLESTISGQ